MKTLSRQGTIPYCLYGLSPVTFRLSQLVSKDEQIDEFKPSFTTR